MSTIGDDATLRAKVQELRLALIEALKDAGLLEAATKLAAYDQLHTLPLSLLMTDLRFIFAAVETHRERIQDVRLMAQRAGEDVHTEVCAGLATLLARTSRAERTMVELHRTLADILDTALQPPRR